MCRMLLAVGAFDTDTLVAGFLRMARGLGELNEHNTSRGAFTHGDGWGALVRHGGELVAHHSARPCWEEDVRKIVGKPEGLLLLHARQGPKPRLENCHPFRGFHGHEFWFAHQGNVWEPLPDRGCYGTTDSERLLNRLLTAEPDLRRLRHEDFSALNCFLVGPKIQVLSRRKTNTRYNTMRLARLPHATIVSSERIAGVPGWQALPDGTFVEFSYKSS